MRKNITKEKIGVDTNERKLNGTTASKNCMATYGRSNLFESNL